MSTCALCGNAIARDDELCAHHVLQEAGEWAAGNRALCALLHDGVPLTRLAQSDRDDGAWPGGGDA